jgi:large subunit ribosomal protein LP1
MPLNVSPSEKQELLVVFASLILHDDKVAITAENITKLITAAGATVEPYWPKLFGN